MLCTSNNICCMCSWVFILQ